MPELKRFKTKMLIELETENMFPGWLDKRFKEWCNTMTAGIRVSNVPIQPMWEEIPKPPTGS